MAVALTVSPCRGHLNLLYQPYPDLYVDATLYVCFLEYLLGRLPGPLILLHDQAPIHKGPLLEALCAAHPRLDLYYLPIYAPELNPAEWLWGYSKGHRLENYAPADVPELLEAVCYCLEDIRHDQMLLRSFLAATPLSWDGLTVFF